MTRKEFIKKIGIGIAAIFVAPKIIEQIPEEKPFKWIEHEHWKAKEEWETLYVDGYKLHKRIWL